MSKRITIMITGGGTFTFDPGTVLHGEVMDLLAGHYMPDEIDSPLFYAIETTEKSLREFGKPQPKEREVADEG